ncbi:alanine--tRNA ligase [Candidatus Uhrbacteria bacterium]|nr:alanine--tRNA ligase [Candidatus Uhrbacteria bacterium]
MTLFEIRRRYLDFFAARGHAILPSAPLIPENDPTTLFTGSGMQPMVPYLLGERHPRGVRLTDSQKCFRTQDIEEVGDNRHTTFFEMLGNWSLGDYFKREQITWLFEFLTQELRIPVTRLWVTCFEGDRVHDIPKDAESPKIWAELGLPKERIRFYGSQKNWWSRAGTPENMPVGEPGGPDTEVFYEFTQVAHDPKYGKECHPNCDCGRFLEIGNSVFMEYKKTTAGFEPLPQKNVDFGGGLERLAAAVADNPDIFIIDVFEPMRATLERVSGKTYGAADDTNKAFRVILDHLRAATFLIADGAQPSNKDQGYFTRRLMRRAIRYAHMLGIRAQFCAEVARAVVEAYKDAYPNLVASQRLIVDEMEKEEEKFSITLAQGLKKFDEFVLSRAPKHGRIGVAHDQDILYGKDAFLLYQSFGFPKELMQELVGERGIQFDEEGFDQEVKAHQDLSRKGAQKKFHGGLADHSPKTIMGHTATHLLHAALRKVLGEHVKQSGSNITPERLRFDFTHPQALTEAELRKVEELINAAIARDFPVSWQEMTVDEAYKKNAIGFFPERYDERVKVYSIGDPDMPAIADPKQPTFSQEICGGPHVAHTGVIGHVRILKEEALGAGLRRIKAVVEPTETGEVPIAQNRMV